MSSCILLLLAIFASSVSNVRPDGFFLSTIFTIAGILFSIGIGLIVTFKPERTQSQHLACPKFFPLSFWPVNGLLHFKSVPF